jgi:putative endonuclease
MPEWFLYIIECRTKELYVGIAEDVQKRLEQHNKRRACRYTKFRAPVRLVYSEYCGNYASARKREREVKKFSRAKKLSLTQDLSPRKAGLEVQKFGAQIFGEMAEWSIASASKADIPQGIGGSNPPLSEIFSFELSVTSGGREGSRRHRGFSPHLWPVDFPLLV